MIRFDRRFWAEAHWQAPLDELERLSAEKQRDVIARVLSDVFEAPDSRDPGDLQAEVERLEDLAFDAEDAGDSSAREVFMRRARGVDAYLALWEGDYENAFYDARQSIDEKAFLEALQQRLVELRPS